MYKTENLPNIFEILSLLNRSSRGDYGVLCTANDTHYFIRHTTVSKDYMKWLEQMAYLTVLAQPDRKNEYRITLTKRGLKLCD